MNPETAAERRELETGPEVESSSEDRGLREPQSESEPELQSEPEPEPRSELQSESELEPEPELQSESEPEPEFEPRSELQSELEAILFSSELPLAAKRLAGLTQSTPGKVLEAIDALNLFYGDTDRAFRVAPIAGGFQLVTTATHAPTLARLHREKVPARLSRAALETLAIIAFKQPVTRAEIDSIRGVSASDGVLRHLMERKLARLVGRAEAPGRPLLYGTTREFLAYFGLSVLEDLPRTDELEALLAGETPSSATIDEELQEALGEEGVAEASETETSLTDGSRRVMIGQDAETSFPSAELQSHSGEELDEDAGDPAPQ